LLIFRYDGSPLPAALVDRGQRRCLRLKDGGGQKLAYVYYEEELGPVIRSQAASEIFSRFSTRTKVETVAPRYSTAPP